MLLLEIGKENNMKSKNLKREKPQKVSSIFDEIVGQTSDESENIKDLKDNELVILAKKGNKKAIAILINKYKNFVRARSKFYFIIGADKEDIVQEGLIGLYKAIRDYNPDKKTSFRAFAELCIMRQIITAIKTATRQKHTPLNSYISLNKPIFEENGERVLSDVIVSTRNVNPEEIYITLELTKDIKEKMKKYLSSLEAKVLSEYLRGLSYHEVAKSIGKHIKSVDNALQRIKRKIQQTIKESYGD
ncbi:MAG: RNA polymerase sporulation sigma factor SigH [bacterium]|nr:RNA polymerase sporulation sigma factor SigH [bacterium]